MSIYVNQRKLLEDTDTPKSYWNLVDGTADFSGDWSNKNWMTDNKVITPCGNKALSKNTAWNSVCGKLEITQDHLYTFSYSIKFNSTEANNGVMKFYNDDLHRTQPLKDVAVAINNAPRNQWLRVYVTFKALKSCTIYIGLGTSTNISFDIGDFMVNEGTIPLDWNYSLSDIRNKFGGVSSHLYTHLNKAYVTSYEMEVA